MTVNSHFELQWGPALCGFMVSSALYGCTLGQCMFYFMNFPNDLWWLKAMVSFLFVMDGMHTYCVAGSNWKYLVACHGARSVVACAPQLPLTLIASMLITCIVTLMTHCFYAHRIWIISGRNVLLTVLIMATALTKIASGSMATYIAIQTRSMASISNDPWSIRSAILSAVCDSLITGSVFFYLREGRRNIQRSRNYFRHLTIVFINMGLFTCLISLGWCLLFVVQGGYPFVALPTSFISKAYGNSMMAVLNARKVVREREQDLLVNGYDLATIDVAVRDENLN